MQGDAAPRLRISVQRNVVARYRDHGAFAQKSREGQGVRGKPEGFYRKHGAFESRDASKTRSARKRRRERTVTTAHLRKSRTHFGRIVARKTRSLRKRRRERTKTYVTKACAKATWYSAMNIPQNYSPAWRTPRILSSFSVRPTPRSMSRLPRRASTELMPMPPIISCSSCVQAWTRLTSRL